MTKKRYVFALLAGLAFGIACLFTDALFTTVGYGIFDVPCLNYLEGSDLATLDMLTLFNQAILLRFSELLLDQGAQYLLVPPFIACALANLDQMTAKHRALRCVWKSFQFTVICVLLVSLAIGLIEPNHSADLFFEMYLLQAYRISLMIMLCAWCSFLAPLFWLASFLFIYGRGMQRFSKVEPVG